MNGSFRTFGQGIKEANQPAHLHELVRLFEMLLYHVSIGITLQRMNNKVSN